MPRPKRYNNKRTIRYADRTIEALKKAKRDTDMDEADLIRRFTKEGLLKYGYLPPLDVRKGNK